MAISKPHLTDNGGGVAFTVKVDFVDHECVVTRDALARLSQLGSGDVDLMDLFSTFEANISGVARRMVAAGVQGTPLQLSEKNFPLPKAAS